MKSIIFDLDDTLLDTSGFLIPIAARESCQAMIDAGLNCDIETCLQLRSQLLRSNPRAQVYRELTERIGVRADTYVNDVAFAGHKAFHSRKVEANIQLRAGATELLKTLHGKYRLIGISRNSKTKNRFIKYRKLF
jgi:putative hydrolase of the HAD superfamily